LALQEDAAFALVEYLLLRPIKRKPKPTIGRFYPRSKSSAKPFLVTLAAWAAEVAMLLYTALNGLTITPS
jgi:hypothetical protein